MSVLAELQEPLRSFNVVQWERMNLIIIALLTALSVPAQPVRNADKPIEVSNIGNTITLIPQALFYHDRCDKTVRSIATNFAEDIKGDPDNRPSTWGDAGYIVKRINFAPKPGCRVRIDRVYGDFVVWPIGLVPPGKFAGTLLGLQTTAGEGSIQADWAADNTFLYIQVATGGAPERAAFDYQVGPGGLLQSDNAMLVKMAVWLNDTGLVIHMEPSFVVQFHYEESK